MPGCFCYHLLYEALDLIEPVKENSHMMNAT